MGLPVADFKFDWIEYSIVFSLLVLSTLIGVYYTCFNKQDTFSDYMLGGKSMGIFPVSMSLIASVVSGITLLGLPAEVYEYGTQTMIGNIGILSASIIAGVFYVPVYYKLQLNSLFEYLELRFNKSVRIMGNLLLSLAMVLYLPVVIMVPAIAFNQVTDAPVLVVSFIISAICLFYTAFGGLKAVLWTDALQTVFMLLAVVFVCVLGCVRLGGLREVWRINQEGHRLELFNFDPSPFTRNTFWNVSIGLLFTFVNFTSTNPGSIQRYLSLPTLKHAQRALFVMAVGFHVIINLSFFMGFVIFARYYGCDPIAAGVVKKSGQLMPLYVMEVGRDYPGLAGLFMAGVLSSALSTISSWLNTMGGALYKDVMEVFFPNTYHSEAKQSNIIKVIVVVIGLVSCTMVAVVEQLGTILQVGMSLPGIIYGSVIALFSLGIFVPRINSKGVMAGTVTSVLLMGWIISHAQWYIMSGDLKFPGKVTSIDHCPTSMLHKYNSNSSVVSRHTGVGTLVEASDSVSLLYQLSYNYFIVSGTLVSLVVSLTVSLLTPPPDLSAMNRDLFSPYVHRFLPEKVPRVTPDHEIYVLRKNCNVGNVV